MLVIHQRLPARSPRWDEELHLTYEARSKSRLRCFAASGEEVGLFLERGQPPLADGDCLEARDGRLVRVVARPNVCSTSPAPARWNGPEPPTTWATVTSPQVGDGGCACSTTTC